jgi:hypothetical protein
MSAVDPLSLFQKSSSNKRPREDSEDGSLVKHDKSNKKLRKKMKKKRKKLEKKLKKRAKKKAKKEKKKAKKKGKKLKKRETSKKKSSSSSSVSSSSDSDSEDSSEDEENHIQEFNKKLFDVTILNVLNENIALYAPIQQVFGALDSGQGIVLDGIENTTVKNVLQQVFNILPIVKHRNGEQSLYKKSGLILKILLEDAYKRFQTIKEESILQNNNNKSNNIHSPNDNYVSKSFLDATPDFSSIIISSNNNNINHNYGSKNYNNNTEPPQEVSKVDNLTAQIESSDDDDVFGPQTANSSKARVSHRDFTEDEILRTKKFSKKSLTTSSPARSGNSRRGDWMTKLPEGRNLFTQMQASKGPRKFLKTNVDRKLASDGGINLWTATPEERLKIQQDKANKKLLGYDINSNQSNNKSSGGIVGKINLPPSTNRNMNVIRQPVASNNNYRRNLSLLELHRLNTSKNSGSSGTGSDNGATVMNKKKDTKNNAKSNTSWREREFIRGAVDKSNLKNILEGALEMNNRFSSGKM